MLYCPQGRIQAKDVHHIVTNIFSAHRWLGCIFAAFGRSLSKLLAKFVQFACGMRAVSVVIPNHKSLFPLIENEISNVHAVPGDLE